jgi:hypothetical protein
MLSRTPNSGSKNNLLIIRQNLHPLHPKAANASYKFFSFIFHRMAANPTEMNHAMGDL